MINPGPLVAFLLLCIACLRMLTPKENILYLELREINFRAPKHLKLELSSHSGFISSSVITILNIRLLIQVNMKEMIFFMRLPKRRKENMH